MDTRRYLHHARINGGLTLEQIATRTALSPSVLRSLDEGRFERLPSGLYARSYVRAFATAVGLDPEEALDRVEPLLPSPPDPFAELPALTGSATERFVGPRAALLPRRPQPSDAQQSTADVSTQRPFARCAAAAVDGLLLLAVNGTIVLTISWTSGIRLDALLSDAGPALAALVAIPIVLYFLLFGGIAGRTLGRHVCRLSPPLDSSSSMVDVRRGPLTLPEILRRAMG